MKDSTLKKNLLNTLYFVVGMSTIIFRVAKALLPLAVLTYILKIVVSKK